MGEEGLKVLREAADKSGLLVVSEIMNQTQIPLFLEYVDILQVGARNMQNFDLLKELGRVRRPVLLKRGMSATIEEWLLSAEYILAGGNHEVILCERGIRTFESATRNTLDISAIPVVKKRSHLPVLVDPSHGTGSRDKVTPMARAAVAAGADGLLIEVHDDPDKALSDGAQSLYPEQFEQLMAELRVIAPVLGRSLPLARVPAGERPRIPSPSPRAAPSPTRRLAPTAGHQAGSPPRPSPATARPASRCRSARTAGPGAGRGSARRSRGPRPAGVGQGRRERGRGTGA